MHKLNTNHQTASTMMGQADQVWHVVLQLRYGIRCGVCPPAAWALSVTTIDHCSLEGTGLLADSSKCLRSEARFVTQERPCLLFYFDLQHKSG